MLTEQKRNLAEEILQHHTISDEDVLRLRREIFPDGVVDKDEVALIFHLDGQDATRGAAWEGFFVEALTDHYVWQQFPPGVLSEADADELLGRILKDGRVDRATEFRLLVSVIENAKWCPERLVLTAISALREIVLRQDGPLASSLAHRPSTIDAADVILLRKLLFGVAGDGGIGISRGEADLLFELNRETRNAANDPSWPDLFAKAIGQYVLRPGRVTITPDEHIRRERWLDERGSAADFMGRMRDGLMNGKGLAEAFRTVAQTLFGAVDPYQQEAMERLSAQYADHHPASRIDDAEARWLLDRIDGAAGFSPAETALLAFLALEAPEIPASLRPMMTRAGL